MQRAEAKANKLKKPDKAPTRKQITFDANEESVMTAITTKLMKMTTYM